MEDITELIKGFSYTNIEDRMGFELNGVVEKESKNGYNIKNLEQCISCLDYTTLRETDTAVSVKRFVEDLLKRTKKEELPYVASVCTFPNFISLVKDVLKGSNIKTTSVAAGFPAAQTFFDIKLLECEMAIKSGVEELDVVLRVGDVIEKNYQEVYKELLLIKERCKQVKLKVILETGELKSIENIYNAALISMFAGADFIKTSTGKVPVNATPEAVYTMCYAIKQFFERTGKRVGLKIAGGVSKAHNALRFLTLVNHMLGEAWTTPDYFRLGSSQLLDDILREIKVLKENTKPQD